jgi:DNA-binding NarL/FixJ family response regulator
MCDDSSVPVTVLIVDDHAAFRASARTMLELDGFDVVGEAADGVSALELARELEPELVLLDVALPDVSGFDVAERLAEGPAKVILTSSREPQDFGRRVRRSGALGFVPKDRLSGEALSSLLEPAP